MMEHLIGAKFPKATISLLFSDAQTASTVFTFSAKSLGTVGNRRAIAVALVHADATLKTLNSVTVDGKSLSPAVQDVEASAFSSTEIWIGWVDTANTSGDYVFTLSGSTGDIVIFAFEIHNLKSLTPVGTDTEETDATAMSCACLADGVSIAAAARAGAVVTFTWTGDLAEAGEAGNFFSAAMGSHSASGTVTSTADASSSGLFNSVLASFR